MAWFCARNATQVSRLVTGSFAAGQSTEARIAKRWSRRTSGIYARRLFFGVRRCSLCTERTRKQKRRQAGPSRSHGQDHSRTREWRNRFQGDLLLTRAGVRRLKKVESSCDADDANGKFDASKWDKHGKGRVRCQCPSGSEKREGIEVDTEESPLRSQLANRKTHEKGHERRPVRSPSRSCVDCSQPVLYCKRTMCLAVHHRQAPHSTAMLAQQMMSQRTLRRQRARKGCDICSAERRVGRCIEQGDGASHVWQGWLREGYH